VEDGQQEISVSGRESGLGGILDETTSETIYKESIGLNTTRRLTTRWSPWMALAFRLRNDGTS